MTLRGDGLSHTLLSVYLEWETVGWSLALCIRTSVSFIQEHSTGILKAHWWCASCCQDSVWESWGLVPPSPPKQDIGKASNPHLHNRKSEIMTKTFQSSVVVLHYHSDIWRWLPKEVATGVKSGWLWTQMTPASVVSLLFSTVLLLKMSAYILLG